MKFFVIDITEEILPMWQVSLRVFRPADFFFRFEFTALFAATFAAKGGR